MEKGLISIITPCYNTGKYIHRLLDSILNQDYQSVEMFAIDDGSTDNTSEIIKSYIPKFETRGYSLRYIYQPNSGQSAAINKALKLVSGEFLMWPDSDDWFNNTKALSIFISEFQRLDSTYGIIRCLPTFVNENHLEEGEVLPWDDSYALENQFERCLLSDRFFYPPGNYMIRMASLLEVNPEREIYTNKKAGQNWQMMLPILYSFKCQTLNQSLHSVLIRPESHSRGQSNTFRTIISRIDIYEETILETLKRIHFKDEQQRTQYLTQVAVCYAKSKMRIAGKYWKGESFKKYRKLLKSYGVKLSLYEHFLGWAQTGKLQRAVFLKIEKMYQHYFLK